MDLRGTRSNSQIPTLFPHRFPVNSDALTSVEGLAEIHVIVTGDEPVSHVVLEARILA
jgi:hypothetical protein